MPKPDRIPAIPVALTAAIVFAFLALPLPAHAAPADDPETVTIDGDTYRIVGKTLLDRWGFEPIDIPREENAAWVYIEAIDSMNMWPEDPKLLQRFEHVLGHGFTEDFPELRAWVRRQRDGIALLCKASRMERYGFPLLLDHPMPREPLVAAVLSPHLNSMRLASRLLVVEAWLHADEGQFEEAVESLATIHRMSAHAAKPGVMIDGLVGLALDAIGNDAVRNIVRRHEIPEKHLAELQKTMTEAWRKAPTAADIYEGERRWNRAVVDDVFSGRVSLDEIGVFGLEPHGESFIRSLIGSEGLRAVLPDRTVAGHFGDAFDALKAMSRRPAWALKESSDARKSYDKPIPQWNVLGRVLMPVLGRASLAFAKGRIDNELTRTLIALHRYKADTGHFPNRIERLVPDYLDAVPTDGWDPDGKPLRYRRSLDPAGYTIYSVGYNGKDNGGGPDVLHSDLSRDPGDYGFAYPMPPPEPFKEREEEPGIGFDPFD